MSMLLEVLSPEVLVGSLETGDHHADKEVHDDEGYHHHIGEEKEGSLPRIPRQMELQPPPQARACSHLRAPHLQPQLKRRPRR